MWVFAVALACSSSVSDAPESEPSVESGDDSTTDDSATDDPATDADGDGYDSSVDCDDSEPDVHPDAKETCGNGRDDNCNGTADGCDWSGEMVLDGTVLSTRAQGSGLGFSLAVCDANGDGVDDVVTGAFGHNDMIGAVYVAVCSSSFLAPLTPPRPSPARPKTSPSPLACGTPRRSAPRATASRTRP